MEVEVREWVGENEEEEGRKEKRKGWNEAGMERGRKDSEDF